jgi:glycosyltransferase involved in cell wall biosynthesis
LEHTSQREYSTEPESSPRVLVFSQRNLAQIQPFRCAHFEFEDVIAEIDSVDILAPRFSNTSARYNRAKQLAYKTPIKLNPGMPSSSIDSGYDLFFAICGNPTDLLSIHALGDWRSKCKKAVCLIDELWVTQMGNYDRYLRMLEDFDVVVIYYSQSVGPLNQRIGPKSVFLPPAVDAVRFCPYPDLLPRSIDVYSVGRRSAITHHSLLQMVARDRFFYLYDTTSADRVLDPIEHRKLVANVLKRSRYYIVNPGLIDRPDVRGDQIEIGNRYFEGAAAGAILIGQRPDNGKFETFFDWPHAIVDLPYDSAGFAEAIEAIENNPQMEDAIRRTNVRQSLLRHDWMYRWEAILQAVGMDGLEKLNGRKQYLQTLADSIVGSDSMGMTELYAQGDSIQN